MPAAALPALTFSVALPPALMDVGVTEALAPLGVPDTARLIVPPVPTTVVEMVLEPLVPCTRQSGSALAWTAVTELGGVPVGCTVIESVTGPSVPVTLSVLPPAPTRPPFPYTALFRSALMDVGVTEALAPLGVPDTARLIVPPVPTTVVEMVLEPLVPCTR